MYADDQGHILVWVAPLRANTGVYDEQGNVVVKPLAPPFDGSFDTDYIQCAALPYVVRKTADQVPPSPAQRSKYARARDAAALVAAQRSMPPAGVGIKACRPGAGSPGRARTRRRLLREGT